MNYLDLPLADRVKDKLYHVKDHTMSELSHSPNHHSVGETQDCSHLQNKILDICLNPTVEVRAQNVIPDDLIISPPETFREEVRVKLPKAPKNIFNTSDAECQDDSSCCPETSFRGSEQHNRLDEELVMNLKLRLDESPVVITLPGLESKQTMQDYIGENTVTMDTLSSSVVETDLQNSSACNEVDTLGSVAGSGPTVKVKEGSDKLKLINEHSFSVEPSLLITGQIHQVKCSSLHKEDIQDEHCRDFSANSKVASNEELKGNDKQSLPELEFTDAEYTYEKALGLDVLSSNKDTTCDNFVNQVVQMDLITETTMQSVEVDCAVTKNLHFTECEDREQELVLKSNDVETESSVISSVADVVSSSPIKQIRSDNTLQDGEVCSNRSVDVGLSVNQRSTQKKKIARRRSMRNISRRVQSLNDALLVGEVNSELKEEVASSKLTGSREKCDLSRDHRDVCEQRSGDVESMTLLKSKNGQVDLVSQLNGVEGESSVISTVTDIMASVSPKHITGDESEMKNDGQHHDTLSPVGRSDSIELTKEGVLERKKRRKRRQSRSTSCKKKNDLNEGVIPNEDNKQDVSGRTVFGGLLPSDVVSDCLEGDVTELQAMTVNKDYVLSGFDIPNTDSYTAVEIVDLKHKVDSTSNTVSDVYCNSSMLSKESHILSNGDQTAVTSGKGSLEQGCSSGKLDALSSQEDCTESDDFVKEHVEKQSEEMLPKNRKIRRRSSDYDVISTLKVLQIDDKENYSDTCGINRRSKRLFLKALTTHHSGKGTTDKGVKRQKPDSSLDEDKGRTLNGLVKTGDRCYSCIQTDVSDSPELPECISSADSDEGVQSVSNAEQVTDIYLNKLWKSQMPVDRCWETIYEDPTRSRTLMSKSRQQRYINFGKFYARRRLNKRYKKALSLGWKPPTVEELDKFSVLLDEKLSELDKSIENVLLEKS